MNTISAQSNEQFKKVAVLPLRQEGLFERIPIELIKNIMDKLPVQNKGVLEGFQTVEKFFPNDRPAQIEWISKLNVPISLLSLPELPHELLPHINALEMDSLPKKEFVDLFLPQMSNLQYLLSPLTKDVISCFSSLPCPEQLKGLTDSTKNEDGQRLTDYESASLKMFKGLKELALQRHPLLTANTCFMYDFSQLTHLSIRGSNFFQGFKFIMNPLKNLEVFHITANSLNDEDLGFLASCNKLRKLSINSLKFLKVTGSFLEKFSSKVLEEFHLVNQSGVPATGMNLDFLGRCKSLKKIFFMRVYTGNCFAALKDIPLKELHLDKCNALTKEGQESLNDLHVESVTISNSVPAYFH